MSSDERAASSTKAAPLVATLRPSSGRRALAEGRWELPRRWSALSGETW